MAKITIDPENYYKNCKPRPHEEAEENMDKFQSELSLLRDKYKIADMVYVIRSTTDIGDLMTSGKMGSEIVCDSLIERAFRQKPSPEGEEIPRGEQ